MKMDPEVLQQKLLVWLLQEPSSTTPLVREKFPAVLSSGGGPVLAPDASNDLSSVADHEVDGLELNLELIDSEEMELLSLEFLESQDFSPHSGRQTLNLGEIKPVQDRFHVLLKRRLQSEIQQHPPLFPWETEISDYEATDHLNSAEAALTATSFWGTQLRNLQLPVPVPEQILVRLLERCQQIAQSSLLEGARLVSVVESFFPGETDNLNYLAGLVVATPNRSGASTSERLRENFPPSYESANSMQQMLLSLLASREIMSTLCIGLSPANSTVSREWLTSNGLLKLEVQGEFQPTSKLRVQAYLPDAGSLKLSTTTAQATAYQSGSGSLSVELFEPQASQIHRLEVQLDDAGHSPLVFSIQVTAEP